MAASRSAAKRARNPAAADVLAALCRAKAFTAMPKDFYLLADLALIEQKIAEILAPLITDLRRDREDDFEREQVKNARDILLRAARRMPRRFPDKARLLRMAAHHDIALLRHRTRLQRDKGLLNNILWQLYAVIRHTTRSTVRQKAILRRILPPILDAFRNEYPDLVPGRGRDLEKRFQRLLGWMDHSAKEVGISGYRDEMLMAMRMGIFFGDPRFDPELFPPRWRIGTNPAR